MEKKTDFDICKEIENVLRDNQINIIGENGTRIYMYSIFMETLKSIPNLSYTYNETKQIFNKCMEIYLNNTCKKTVNIKVIIPLVIFYWEDIKDMSTEKVSEYIDKGDFQSIIADRQSKYIEQMLSQTIKEFDLLKKGIGTIDLKNDNKEWIADIQELFVINEFIAFLKNEIERAKTKGEYKLEPLVPLRDYETIMSEDIEIIDVVLEFFWNSECGVSYEDFAEMLKEMAREMEEIKYYEDIQQQ